MPLVDLERDEIERAYLALKAADLERGVQDKLRSALSQPEHQGDEESEWRKLMDAPIQRPGKVYVKHDNEARTGEWMDGEQVNALVRSLRQPPASVLSDEEREQLCRIAAYVGGDAGGPGNAQKEGDAAFLRNLASREHRGEEER